MRELLSMSLLCFVIGCGGGDGPTLGGDVVGRWRELPNATDADPPEPEADRSTLEFTADGRWTETESGNSSTGTYTLAGGEITVSEDGEAGSVTIPYLATASRLVVGALVPAGDGDSVIDTWTATTTSPEGTTTLTLDLRADNTAQVVFDRSVPPDEMYDGTWTQVGDDLGVTFQVEDNFTFTMRMSHVAGVLGTAYERL